MGQPFSKRIFTPQSYRASVNALVLHLDDLRPTADGRISRAFAERIMLAVTQVNGCRYCQYAHARMALTAGVTPAEVEALLRRDLGALPAEELPALLFAQHHAESGGQPDPAALARLEATYGAETARHIRATIRMISFGNLLGNTFDALLARLRGAGAPGSKWWQEAAVLFSAAFVLPVRVAGALLAARLGAAPPPAHRKTVIPDA